MVGELSHVDGGVGGMTGVEVVWCQVDTVGAGVLLAGDGTRICGNATGVAGVEVAGVGDVGGVAGIIGSDVTGAV